MKNDVMQSIAIIGLSSFGTYLCEALRGLKAEVLAIDVDEERVDAVADTVNRAVVADARDPEAISDLGLEDMDCVILSLGERLDFAILVLLHVLELGVENVIVKAMNEDHAKVLERLGASEVVIPERDMAERLAHKLMRPNLLDYMPLGEGCSLVELEAPEAWTGKSLRELDLNRRHQVQVVMVRNAASSERFIFAPPDYEVGEGDTLVLGGRDEDLEAVEKL